jgi:hypothetical protein
MNASEILAIKHPERLFTGNLVEAKKEYYNLSRKWHPDVNKEELAGQVFAHISSLYHSAEEKLAHGAWGFSTLMLLDTAGINHTVKYHTGGLFELGAYYIGEDQVTYVLDDIYEDLWLNAEAMTQKFNFSSERMAKEMGRCLPDPIKAFKTKDDLVLVVSKPSKFIRLRDVLEHYGGKTDPKHVAWIQSRLHNICCYLHYAKLCHNEISPDTVFIDPADHSVILLGGWWYSRPAGKSLKHVSKRTHGLLPWKVKMDKRASRKTDLELVKATGRELFGPGGKAPAAMADYLKVVATKNAFDEYKDWSEVLLKSFGSRRFTVMDLKPEQVYPIG